MEQTLYRCPVCKLPNLTRDDLVHHRCRSKPRGYGANSQRLTRREISQALAAGPQPAPAAATRHD